MPAPSIIAAVARVDTVIPIMMPASHEGVGRPPPTDSLNLVVIAAAPPLHADNARWRNNCNVNWITQAA
jgi:hypothetical protein